MIICLRVTSHLRQKQMTNIHVTRGGKRTHKELQVSSTDQTIASVVAWSTDHQHRGPGLDQWGEWVSLRRGDLIYSPAAQLSTDCSSVWPEPHPCDGCGTAESSQFHQLVHAEAVLREELLVDVLRLLLPAQNLQLSVNQQTVCVCMCVVSVFFSQSNSQPYPRYLMVWAMVDAGLLLTHDVFVGPLLEAGTEHVPVWARTVVAREVTRTPIPNRARTLNIQRDARAGEKNEKMKQHKLKKKKNFLYERLQAEYL